MMTFGPIAADTSAIPAEPPTSSVLLFAVISALALVRREVLAADREKSSEGR